MVCKRINQAYLAQQRGLTLIELLVVMVILAFTATIVIINMPPQRNAARQAAEDLATAVTRSYDDAVVTGAIYRVEFSLDGWRISRFVDDEWVTATEAVKIPAGLIIDAEVEDPAASNAIALSGIDRDTEVDDDELIIAALDPFGIAPIFTARFRAGQNEWAARFQTDGFVEVERVE